MSEKLSRSQDEQAASGTQYAKLYVAPSLVRYGSLFVETGMVCSAAGTDDPTKCDIGDKDNSPAMVDG